VIDVGAVDKITPRKGWAALPALDLISLIINKIDLRPLVGADLDVMDRDCRKKKKKKKKNRAVSGPFVLVQSKKWHRC